MRETFFTPFMIWVVGKIAVEFDKIEHGCLMLEEFIMHSSLTPVIMPYERIAEKERLKAFKILCDAVLVKWEKIHLFNQNSVMAEQRGQAIAAVRALTDSIKPEENPAERVADEIIGQYAR